MSTSYTLRDLLTEEHLGLEVVSGSQESLDRNLCGAHSIETDSPAQKLEPGWLMLTMGTRLRNKPAEQRRLVAELQELGAAALGFGVGLAFKSVPAALLDEAAKRDFPVVLVPTETSFQEISRVVFQYTMSDEAQAYRRLTALQHNLMRAFADDDPVMSTLRRLSRFSNCVAAVVAADGRVHASTGTLPFDEVSGMVRDLPSVGPKRTADGWDIVTASLSTWQSEQPVSLVLASKPATSTPSGIRMLLDIAVPVFEALGRLTIANRRHDEALNRALLENALAKRLTDVESAQFEQHVSAAGIPIANGVHCVVIDCAGQPDRLTALEECLRSGHSAFPSLFMRHGEQLVIMTPASNSTLDALRRYFGAARLEGVRLAVGRRVTAAQDLAVSQRDASIVLRYLDREAVGGALTFDDLDLASQMMAEVSPDRIAAKSQAIIDLLERQPIQLEAIRAYFDTCLDVQAAAKRIYVHPNTLRYRLDRLESALGRSLRDPAMIASMHYVLSIMQQPSSEPGARGELVAGTS